MIGYHDELIYCRAAAHTLSYTLAHAININFISTAL